MKSVVIYFKKNVWLKVIIVYSNFPSCCRVVVTSIITSPGWLVGSTPRSAALVRSSRCFDAPPTHLTAHALEAVRRRRERETTGNDLEDQQVARGLTGNTIWCMCGCCQEAAVDPPCADGLTSEFPKAFSNESSPLLYEVFTEGLKN